MNESLFVKIFNIGYRLVTSTNLLYRNVSYNIIETIKNTKRLDCTDSQMLATQINDKEYGFFFIFVDSDDYMKFNTIELFIPGYKRAFAILVSNNLLTSNTDNEIIIRFIDGLYDFIINLYKPIYESETDKRYDDSELHYLLDIAPSIMTLIALSEDIPLESLEIIYTLLKQYAPRYDYDKKIIHELFDYIRTFSYFSEAVSDLFDTYKLNKLFRDFYTNGIE